MKAVIQVVKDAELTVYDKLISKIGQGIVVFFCVEKGDEEEKLQYFSKKIANLRIFSDENGKTNLSVQDVKGEILLVSQFTLAGDCEHGNRPYFINAEAPERANRMYEELGKMIRETYDIPVKMGAFGEEMIIKQTNDGPFTILLEK
ncbi:MAG: D-tyrosyl-tRNA(Tyr) deacylase [Clostridiales bacterium]|nr:D-tyrosyl-tRNA(Tyr) deacylase [Clostridiales bacterium]